MDSMQGLKNLLGGELMYHAVIAAVIIVVFYSLVRVVRALLRFIGHRIIAKTETDLDDRILQVVLDHVRSLMLVTGLFIAVREIRKGAGPVDQTIHQVLDYCGYVLYVVLVFLIVKILLGILREVLDWYLDEAAGGAPSLKKTLGPLAHKAVNVLIGLVAVIIVLDHFGINIGSLLVSLGVGSLAVALAAQETLANMIAGFVLLVDRPFRVGDRIEISSGQIGDVQMIGLRSTRILNADHNLIIIPNAELVRGRIINYAYPFNQMRVLLKFELAYGSDPGKVKHILTELAVNHPDILKDPAPEAYCTALNESSVQFTLVARCADFSRLFNAETTLREQAYLAFLKEGFEIPFPRRVVHMKADA